MALLGWYQVLLAEPRMHARRTTGSSGIAADFAFRCWSCICPTRERARSLASLFEIDLRALSSAAAAALFVMSSAAMGSTTPN